MVNSAGPKMVASVMLTRECLPPVAAEDGVDYVQKEEAAYAEQVRSRLEKQLHRRAKELGFTLTRVPDPPASAEASPLVSTE